MKLQRTSLIVFLIVLLAVPAWAQQPAPVPVPTDPTALLFSHILFIEGRVEALSAQLRDAHAEDLTRQTQLGLQVEAVHEILVVEAAKPNGVVEALTSRTFWEVVAGAVVTVIVAVQQQQKKP